MKSKGIRISDKETWGNVLKVAPKDILELIEHGKELNWAILEIEATGELGEKKWKKLEKCNESQNNISRINWTNLKNTSKQFWQVI